MKKKIKPVKAYVNGKQMTATAFNVVSVSDNLFDHVIFKYTLLTEGGAWAGEAIFELKVSDYKKWDASAEGAYRIVAEGIGLELEPAVDGAFFEEM
jgi:uncharacterized membrane protein